MDVAGNVDELKLIVRTRSLMQTERGEEEGGTEPSE